MLVNWIVPVVHRDYNRMPASVWIRCMQLIPYLEENGVKCTVNACGEDSDVTVFVRSQDEKALNRAQHLKSSGRRVVLDLCVNYFDEGKEPGGRYGVTEEHVQEVEKMLENADAVTCASEYISGKASKKHNRAICLPDSIDRRHFSFSKDRKDFERKRLRVIWSGVAVKAHEIEPVLPLIKSRDLDLVVVSDRKPSLKGTDLIWRIARQRFRKWSYETFPEDILCGDICISPRFDMMSYNMGHSIFKIGVFMAQGVPALASPVPSYTTAIGSGSGGRICRDLDAWAEALDEALGDRDLLRSWSEQAKQKMEEYSTKCVAEQYLKLFDSIV